ncbi:MAG TPA: hypothetical protein VF815_16965 [Myxococcaceae bacterium]
MSTSPVGSPLATATLTGRLVGPGPFGAAPLPRSWRNMTSLVGTTFAAP